jgi:2-aminoadipate transaminase
MRAAVATYRERRDALCTAATAHLSDWFEWEVPPGGMFVWMRAKDGAIDTDALYAHALAENVAFVPSSVFDPSGALKSAMRVISPARRRRCWSKACAVWSGL